MGALLSANLKKDEPSGAEMTKAATKFLSTLTKDQTEKTSFNFDDKERLNWHFIPRERKGLPIKELEGAALKSAMALLRSGLSEAGYDQAVDVMSLEEVLYLLEGGDRETRRSKRDPRKYFVSIFGKPGNNGTWGWRFEGHHLSLNYVIIDGVVKSSTPEFFGANPGLINAGPKRAIRVLGPEEELGRSILKSCTPAQQKVCWIEKKAPDDLRGGGVAQPETTAPVGLPIGKMTDDQKKLMAELLNEYLKNMPSDIEKQRRNQINSAGLDNIYFAWWGSSEQNERHYYRVQGPTFLIEYNNTQQSANHVHSIWRNMSGDFNVAVEQE
jgi:hypothetical protein